MAVSRRLKKYEAEVERTRPKRMAWWNDARFGMFVHWGLYAQIGRQEWALNIECIPPKEYEALADTWKPKPRPMREWAQLAVQAGMKYMVMTTKHHDGFCLWDSRRTDYNPARRGPRRDLVAEYVDACREFGLKVGFYYSLLDWHHPDGIRCKDDQKARRRFVDYTHGLVRELMTHYGRIDILWYDVACPLRTAEQWESLAMNTMVRKLQPDILINNRSHLAEDFSTPEGQVSPAESGRGWEACMTFNDASWGYMPSAAVDALGPRAILKMLHTASANQGNLLLNIGPAPDGSVPQEAVAPLTAVGKWLRENGEAVYGRVDRGAPGMSTACGQFSRKGKVLYFWCRHWVGPQLVLGGFKTRLQKASLLMDGRSIPFTQKGKRIILHGLPEACPDQNAGIAVVKMEFASKPIHQFGQFKFW